MDEPMKLNEEQFYELKFNELRKINERLEKLEKFIDPDSLLTVGEMIEMYDMFMSGPITEDSGEDNLYKLKKRRANDFFTACLFVFTVVMAKFYIKN